MKKVWNAIMKGFSYYLPVIVVATILTEISLLVSAHPEMVEFFSFSGYMVFQIAYAVLAGFIAFALADRLALLPGLLGGYMVVRYDLGFLSAIIIGLFVGYLVVGLKYVIKKSPKTLQQTLMIVWIPLVSVIFTYLVIICLRLFMGSITNWYESFFPNLNIVALTVTCGILAMLMAYDLGGPINKLVYVFALSTIGLGVRNSIMPAVMIGGMIPPIAIGLFHLVFKNRFMELKEKSGWQMVLLGSFFISEAALPFYSLYKRKVVVASLLGSLVSGVIIGLARVTSFVPHGGILMFWTASDILMFLAAILSGVFTSFIIMVFTTKNENKMEN